MQITLQTQVVGLSCLPESRFLKFPQAYDSWGASILNEWEVWETHLWAQAQKYGISVFTSRDKYGFSHKAIFKKSKAWLFLFHWSLK